MTFLTSTLAFIVAIGLLVTVHEFGHFLMARLMRVPVLRFSIGFGKPLLRWRSRKSETEFVISALPLGGYVKMLDERDEEFPEGREAEAFNRQPIWRRAVILVGGPLFNFMFAVVAYWIIFVNGIPGFAPNVGQVTEGSPAAIAGIQSRDRILAVNGDKVATWQAVNLALLDGLLDDAPLTLTVRRSGDSPASSRELDIELNVANPRPLTEPGALMPGLGLQLWLPQPVLNEIEPGSPADAAGLRSGDRILAVAGKPVESAADFVESIRAQPGESVEIELERNGRTLEVAVTPASEETEEGIRGRIGAAVGYSQEDWEHVRALEQFGPVAAVAQSVSKTWEISALTLRVLGRMVIGDVSLKNISGPINIASYAGQSASIGILTFMTFLAVVSISLGIINLLPVPVLDGGQLLFLVFEWIKGAPLSAAAEAIGQRVGLLLLAGFMTLAFYNDIARLLGHGG